MTSGNHTIDGFARADTVFVVSKRIRGGIQIRITVLVEAVHLGERVAFQLVSIPRQANFTAVVDRIADFQRVSDSVIGDVSSVELRELIAPRAVPRGDSALEACPRRVSQGNLFI